MKRLLVFTLLFSAVLGMSAQAPAESATESANIEWLTWEEAASRMEKEPRKIMVDVYTDWCGWCKKMDASTMKDPLVTQVMNESYYAVKMDGEQKEEILFKDRVYKFVASGRRGYHELPAELMQGKMSYPTLVFLDEDFKVIQPLPGFRQAKDLEMILSYFGGDYHKSTTWEKFQTEYKSPN